MVDAGAFSALAMPKSKQHRVRAGHDVLRLDVAVDQAAQVERVHRRGQLIEERERAGERHGARAALRERLAVEVLHRR
jgi:hypothetical protein